MSEQVKPSVTAARAMQILADLAKRSPLRMLDGVCEQQKQISTAKLAEYIEQAGDELAGYAFKLRQHNDALHAEAEALRAENGRLQSACDHNKTCAQTANDLADQLSTELEAARGLLRDAIDEIDYMSGALHACKGVDRSAAEAFIASTRAPEVQAESLDDRLKRAGMLSVAELLKGAPLDAFIKHAGVHDLTTLLQWAEMRRGECLRMMARYDLGEKDKEDELYEWTVAHSAVFTELHVNLRAALVEQGERQEAVAWYTEDHLTDKSSTTWSNDVAERWRAKGWPVGNLYTTPQPGPDVRGLVEALEHYAGCGKSGYVARVALAAHRQAQQRGSHDT